MTTCRAERLIPGLEARRADLGSGRERRDSPRAQQFLPPGIRKGSPHRIHQTPGAKPAAARRADLAVGLEVLQGIEHAHRLVDAAAQRLVVHQLVPHHARLVDQEGAAVRGPVVRQDVVGLRDLLLEVGEDWVGDLANAALARPEAAVGEVGVHGVRGHGQHLAAAVLRE